MAKMVVSSFPESAIPRERFNNGTMCIVDGTAVLCPVWPLATEMLRLDLVAFWGRAAGVLGLGACADFDDLCGLDTCWNRAATCRIAGNYEVAKRDNAVGGWHFRGPQVFKKARTVAAPSRRAKLAIDRNCRRRRLNCFRKYRLR
jgi:hypothetical protein